MKRAGVSGIAQDTFFLHVFKPLQLRLLYIVYISRSKSFIYKLSVSEFTQPRHTKPEF